MPDLAAMEPLLIPMPARVELTGGIVDCEAALNASTSSRTAGLTPPSDGWALPTEPTVHDVAGTSALDLPVLYERERDHPSEWYRLQVWKRMSPHLPPFKIWSRDRIGAQLAMTTLRQLLRQYAGRIPAMIIEDQPAFAHRGIMLDVSRDRVPLQEELSLASSQFAALKINHVQLYTEHTFAYAGHEEVWSGWSPITAEEVRKLVQRFGYLNVELAANQNCFGHLASWLRHPKYAHLAETHGDWVFDVWPRSGPFSLCPVDPKSLELVEDMLGQLLPCFTSLLVNIGCDETYDIGFGRSKEEVAKRGRAAVYMEFVSKIAAVARKHGKRPMFWADIALSHPECVKDIPDDMISLAWGYEPEAQFARWCELLREAGREVWVCPGTSSWRSITGRTTERHGNIKAAAEQGTAGGASGFLMCDWGDTGHHQQWPISLMGIAHGAAAAWNPKAPFDPRAASLHVFGDRSLSVGPWLEELGDVDLKLRQTCGALSAPGRIKLPNQSAMFIDMLKKLEEQVEVGKLKDWEEAADRIEQLSKTPCRQTCPPRLNDELRHTIEVARFAAARGVGRRRPGGLTKADRNVLRDQLEGIIAEHRRLWLVRSRVGGLDHSCTYYRNIDL